MLHLLGYYQSVDQGGAAANINAMSDETVFYQGTIIRVPPEVPFLCGAALLTAATTLTGAQIRTPTLRSLAYFDIEPLVQADNFANPPALAYFPGNPIALAPQEAMQFNTNTDNAAAVAIQGLVWLGDGPQQSVDGEIFSVRCTAAITLAAGTWTSGNLTFSQELPFGTYDVVGMRARGTNLQAARLVFPGGRWRPGVPAGTGIGDVDEPRFRFGRSGVFGTFESTAPPQVECVGHTDTAQTIFLDLIKTG